MEKVLRSYLYISDAKVDSLLPQASRRVQRRLRSSTRKTETRLAIGAIGARGELRTAKESERSSNRIERLEQAERLVRHSEPTGSIADDKHWIDDEIIMRWGLVYSPPGDPVRGPLAVTFVGQRDRQVLALGGSVHHVMGYEGSVRRAGSSRLPLWFRRWDHYEERGSVANLRRLAAYRFTKDSLRHRMFGPLHAPDPFERIRSLLDDACWPEQRVQFLAERLTTREDVNTPSQNEGVRVTIATPLYVIGS